VEHGRGEKFHALLSISHNGHISLISAVYNEAMVVSGDVSGSRDEGKAVSQPRAALAAQIEGRPCHVA
jgi:hypothetical protein